MGKQLSACARVMMLGAALLGPHIVLAAPPAPPDESAGARVNLALDTTILGSEVAARLELDIAEQLGPVLEQADLPASEAGSVQTLSVRVLAFDEEQRNYEVELELGSEGGVTTSATVRCDACNERRLITKLIEEAPRLIDVHGEKLVEKDGNEGVHGPQRPDESPCVAQPAPEVPKRLMGPLGTTGAAMLGVGVVGLAAGSYLLGRGRVFEGGAADAADIEQEPKTDLRPAAAGTLGVGLAFAGLGAALLALDLERARKGHAGSFALQVTPGYVGIQIVQRF